jgi:hypothetical protein
MTSPIGLCGVATVAIGRSIAQCVSRASEVFSVYALSVVMAATRITCRAGLCSTTSVPLVAAADALLLT